MIKKIRFGLVAALGLLVLAACGNPNPPSTTRTLTVNVAGNGSVTSDPAGLDTNVEPTGTFNAGTEVTLTAVADAGWQFDGWSGGDCSGTGTCELTLNDNTTVTATFSEIVEPVTLTVTVNGDGNVTSAPAGINTGAAQTSAEFAAGSTVVLTATADAGNALTGWSVAGCGTSTTCSVTLDEDTTVTVDFGATTSATAVANNLAEEFLATSMVNASWPACSDGPRFPTGFNRGVNDGSSDLDFGYDADGAASGHRVPVLSGLRFNIAVPQGSVISSASVDFVALAATAAAEGASVSLEVYADKNSAGVNLATRDADCAGSNNLSARASTDAVVSWTISESFGAGDDFSTPDLTAVIQELVDDAGFTGDVVILVRPTDLGSTSYRRAEMVLASTVLNVDYVAP